VKKRAAIIVLDGLGAGPAPDTAAYGDEGSDTLGNVARAVGGLRLPNLEQLGLGRCRPGSGILGLAPGVSPTAAYGVAQPASPGKDSTTGHWEICGVLLERAFRTYPSGFPTALLDEFARRTGRGWLGNKAASGTAIIAELGAEHQRTGSWIVYTSADSVFQIAAHEDSVPLKELYRACEVAREMLIGEHAVSRVIARPFVGGGGGGGGGAPAEYRRSANRRDFSLEPVGTTLLDRMAEAGVRRVGIGKVDDLFAGRNIASEHTPTNGDAYRLIEQALDEVETGFVFVNVIEFDQTWGHRNDVAGFHQGLRELDAWVPRLIARLRRDDLVILTADHGNDPTTPSTDHSREVVPVLVLGPRVKPVALGVRRTFADLGQTVAEYFGLTRLAAGTSFLGEAWGGA
jgi:phosphopentomutase